jgi:hypothetical protein
MDIAVKGKTEKERHDMDIGYIPQYIFRSECVDGFGL